jgi:hypothetical protein
MSFIPEAQRESTLSSTVATDLLQRLANLNVDRSHGQRKPHKPLLFLLALQRLVVRGEREVAFVDIERALRPVLDFYAPPMKASHQPALPYRHLQTDGVWELPHVVAIVRTAKGFPTIDTDALRFHVARPNPTRGVTQVLEFGGHCLMPSEACANTQRPDMSKSLALM